MACDLQEHAGREAGPAYHVSSQINAEDGNDTQRQRGRRQDEEQEGRDLRNVGGQCVGDGLLQVVKDQATWVHASEASKDASKQAGFRTLFHASDDGGEVVVEQNLNPNPRYTTQSRLASE